MVTLEELTSVIGVIDEVNCKILRLAVKKA